MSYKTLQLKDGDTLNASHIEHIENGILSLEDSIAISANYVDTQMGTLNGSAVIDSTNTVIIYNIEAKTGYKLGLTDYSTYMFYIKTIDLENNTSGDLSGWYKEEYVFSNTYSSIAVYVRNHEKTTLDSAVAPDEVSKLFYLKDSNDNVIYGVQTNTSSSTTLIEHISLNPYETRYNTYNANKTVEIPSEFSKFPLEFKVSEQDGVYGCNIKACNYIKNTSKTATYFLSTTGSDENDGLTPDTAFITLDKALSMDDADTILVLEGKYYGGTNYTNGLVISDVFNIIGLGTVEFFNGSKPIDIQNECYVENISFIGGSSALTTHLTTELVVFNRCKFLGATGSNGLTALGGYFILEQCEASRNYLDGFNYHSNSGHYNYVIEIECCGFKNGTSQRSINNATTMHEAGMIVRINGTYGISNGGVVADADGAKSLNYNCISYCNQYLTNENRMGSYVCIGKGSIMWLYDCIAFGCKYDIISDAGITYSNKTYNKEFTPNSGTITRL